MAGLPVVPTAVQENWTERLNAQLYRRLVRHAYVQLTALLVVLAAGLLAARLVAQRPIELKGAAFGLMHSFLEVGSIVACILVVSIARAPRAERMSRNIMLIGVAFLGVALLDFLHSHGAPSMPAWAPPQVSDTSGFWIAARWLTAAALLATATLPWGATVRARHMTVWLSLMVGAVVALAWWMARRPPASPDATTQATTELLAVVNDWALVAVCIAAAVGMLRVLAAPAAKADGGAGVCDPATLACACALTAMSQVLLSVSAHAGDLLNLAGHVFKVCGLLFVYRGLVHARRHEIETRAMLALEGAQLGAWAWDPQSNVLEFDDTAALIWGLPAGIPTTIEAIESQVHPEDAAQHRAALARALSPEENGIYASDFRIIGRDGTAHHIVSRATAEFHNGKPARLIGVVRDDTQRWRLDEAQRLSEARLTGILSIAADAIISIDEGGRIILFNQGAEQIFRYRAEEIMGKPLDVLIPPRFRVEHGGHVKRFAASGVTAQKMGERREVAGLRKDGSEFPAEASISKLVIGNVTTFSVVLRDVTDRKLLEQDLERRVEVRTAELSALLDAVPDGIVQTDSDRIIRTPNAAVSALFGYSREELIGKPVGLLLAARNDEAATARAWEALDGKKTADAATIACRRKDGTVFTAIVRGSAVKDASGHVVSRVGMIRDVTEELQRQQALAVAQRMEAFGQLTGGIAHDFNNLLTVISGNMELLEMRIEDEKQATLLKRAQAAAEMGARLTSRLLTFARRRQLAASLISLNEQITQMVDLLRRSIGEQITLTTSLAPRLPLVKVDPSEIENAVLNLAINARDAMPSGGSIVIETSELAAGGDAEPGDPPGGKLKHGRYVRLSVTDTGSGMPPEVAQRAFEPFFTTKAHGKGTGLGLSTIHGFAQQSGGAVTIDSAPGQGTTVSIYLPCASDEGPSPAVMTYEEGIPLAAGEQVLLVEDNAEVREIARVLLEGLGYGVQEAASGVEALERLKSGLATFALVFCDVVMPGGVSGFDVARWLKSNAPQTRILLTSGFPDDVAADVDRNSAEYSTILGKPYNRVELARALRHALDR